MDLTQAIIAKSDQLNASDLISGPRDFTITEVREGNSDQPCQIFLAEWPGRPFKPSKTVMRILVHAWGKETDDWPQDARMRLFRDPTAKWAGEEVGGIRASHLSHIDAPFKLALRESQKKSVLYKVDVLPDLSPIDKLKAEWRNADPDRRKAIEAEVSALQAGRPTEDGAS